MTRSVNDDMMRDIMRCPACAGVVIAVNGYVVARAPDRTLFIEYKRIVVCTGCALISEVDEQTDILIDLGRHVTEDTLEDDLVFPILVTQRPAMLRGRSES